MKKRFLCFALVFLFCLSFGSTALAASQDEIVPYGAIGLSSGLTHISGSTYKPWASGTAAIYEDFTVGFTLYKNVDGDYVYVTSASKSVVNGNFAKAEKTVTLSPGQYKLYAWYIGETQSDGVNKYYTI